MNRRNKNKKTKKNHAGATRVLDPAGDDARLDELDVIVGRAADGEMRAVGALAIAFGPMLIDEAKAALGPLWAAKAGGVVHELTVRLLSRELAFPAIRHAGIPWLKRVIRELAGEVVRERGRDRAG